MNLKTKFCIKCGSLATNYNGHLHSASMDNSEKVIEAGFCSKCEKFTKDDNSFCMIPPKGCHGKFKSKYGIKL